MDDFTKYQDMFRSGKSADDVCKQAQADGLDTAKTIRLLRSVFGMSLAEAKEVMVISRDLSDSLSNYQSGLAKLIENAANDMLTDEDESEN